MAKALHIPRCWQKLSFLYGTIIALLFATLCWTSATAEIVLRPGASGGVNASDISETRLPTYDFFQRQQSPFKQTGLALFVHFDDGCELQLPGSRTSGNVENASSLIVVVNNTIYKSLCGSFNEAATEIYDARNALKTLGYPQLKAIVLTSPLSEDSAGGPSDRFCSVRADYNCYKLPSFARQSASDSNTQDDAKNSTDQSEDVALVFMNKVAGSTLVSQVSKGPIVITVESETGEWNEYFLSKPWVIFTWVMFALNDIAILIAIQQLVTKYNSGYGALKFVRNSGLISVIVCGALDAAYITMPILRPVRRALSDFTSLFSVIALLLLLYLWVTSLPTARNWHRSAIIITSGFVALLETIVCGVHISHIPASFSSDHVAYSFTQMDTALALVLIVLYVFTAIHYFRNYRKTAMTNTVKRATFKLTIVTGSVMLTWLVVDITAYSYTTPLAHTAGHSMMLQILRGTFITIRQFVLILGFSMVVGRNYPASTPQSPRTPRINVIATGNYANAGSPSPISPVGTYTSRSGLSSPKKLYEDEMADFPHDSRFPAFPAFIPLHK